MQIDPLTFLFELINFVVLVFLLQRWVYRPVAAAILERRLELERTRSTAAERLALVDKRMVELDARDRELDTLRETVFAEATAAASTERAKLLDEARKEASAERSRVQAMLETERDAALGWVRDATVDQGVDVAGRMLLQLVPEALHDALVDRLLASIEEQRAQLGTTAAEEIVAAEAVFARVPSERSSAILKSTLERSLGGPVRLTTTTDERLGAGATLRVRDRVFDASVTGQLELLRENARQQLVKSAS